MNQDSSECLDHNLPLKAVGKHPPGLQDLQDHLQDLQDHLQDLQEHLQDLFQGGFKRS